MGHLQMRDTLTQELSVATDANIELTHLSSKAPICMLFSHFLCYIFLFFPDRELSLMAVFLVLKYK